MANIALLDMSGNEVGSFELNDDVFNTTINEHVMNIAVVHYLANQRQGTKSAKTRAEVSGGGRKPWRQKGTGRARQGSTRSPQWRGGGVVFAPKPRDFSFKLNKKVKRLALKSALSSKYTGNQIIVLDKLQLEEIKTKEMKKVLDNLKSEKALILIESSDKNIQLSARNIQGIKTASINTINIYDILKYDNLIMTKDAAEKIGEVYA